MYYKRDIIRAFKSLHNGNADGDVHLPDDVPQEIVTDDCGEGFWVKNCCVWISIEEIREQLEQLEAYK